jgi:2-oxo-3-hexenedioate decarboxylase
MPPPLDTAGIAREIKRAQDSVVQIEPLTDLFPNFDLPAAYAVARRVCDARRLEGFTTVGRKIGFTNSSLWDTYGVREPIWGYMYDRTVVHLPAREAICSLREFAEPKIEPEIVFGLRSVPEPGADSAVLLRSIEWVAHGFEIVQSHFPGWKFRAPDTVADGGLHGSLVVGPRQPLAQLSTNLVASLESFSLTLLRDDVPMEVGRGSNVLGSPLAALSHLFSVLAEQSESDRLRPGDIVTTGTVTSAYSIKGGEVWRSELRGIPLPGLTIRFTE